MISVYNQYCLEKVFSNVKSCEYYKSELKKFDEYIDVVSTCEHFGTIEYSNKYISYDLFNKNEYKKYTKDSLLSLLNNKKNKAEEQLTSCTLFNKEMVGEDICELISDAESYPEEDKDLWHRKERLDFMEAVAKYGENSIEIWKHQPYYNKRAMEFLAKHPDILPNTQDKCTDMDMGLLCANDKYCHLAVGQVPQLLSWWISEYDGMESIVVDP